jgi:Carbohydrate-selective porin, OprB family
MKRLQLKLLLCSCSIGLSWTIALPARSQTAPIPNAEQNLSQVTSGSQRSDVPPPDWAVRALQSLTDCPNRSDRALSRSELAAAINTCSDKIQELIATTTADSARRQDLATLKRLQAEFAVELATLRKRVDRLDASTTTLERQQFSPTVKLNGEVIIAASSIFTGDRVQNIETNLTQLAERNLDPNPPQVTAAIDAASNLPIISVNDRYVMTVTLLDVNFCWRC